MKKGAVYATSALLQLNPSWYYNWGSKPIPSISTIPYVPMQWGSHSIVPGTPEILLGFNEPDGAHQSNVTPAQAASLWTPLPNGLNGSPATAENPVTGTWLSEFLAQTPKPKVDFICVHWYGPCRASSFLNFVDSVWEKFGLPIWITEFAVADWNATTRSTKYSTDQVVKFINDVLPALDDRPYVQRYAWKTRNTEDVNMWFSALFNDDGTLTDVGKAYSKF